MVQSDMRPSEGHICHLAASFAMMHDPNLVITTFTNPNRVRPQESWLFLHSEAMKS